MAMALRGPQFATRETTELDWALASGLDTRVTVHVGDGEWGKTRPVEWMHSKGMLTPEVTYVHCNTLGDDELRMIADSGGTASVSADIELQMGHGWPATGRLIRAGVQPSLSIDVCVSNGGHMFGTMRAVIGTQRGLDNAAVEAAGGHASALDHLEISCRDVLRFATIEGARACGLEDKIGSLTPGKEADIILVRTDTFGMTPLNNPAGAIVYNAHPGLVDTVLVAGRVVKRGGVMLDVDAARVRRLAEETRDYLLEKGQQDPRLSDIRLGGDWKPAAYATA
jgi:cytosine/adenosine deaminase-related metal-dependent hydrolase